MPNGDGIAEVDPLQQCRILRLFPERLKGHLHRGDSRSQRIGLDVAVGLCPERFLRDSRISKLVGEIHDERFCPDDLRGHNGERDLRQRDHRFDVRSFRGVYGIREQCGIYTAVVLVLLHGGEVLAVFNDHSGLLPTVRMELHREVVPFKLTIPFGEHGAFRAAETGSDAFRLRDGKCLCIRVVRPTREACISCKKLRENELRRTAFGCKWHNGNIGKVIGDVLTVDGDDTVKRLRDAVNTECLVGGGVVGLCLDDALLGDKPVVLTADRVFEQALEHAVSFLSDFAGDSVRQHTKAEGGKIRCIGRV